MPTLYRKYRPQNFSEVVGQNHIKITLEQEIATSKIAHAYLFCGPRAVGKTTMARILTKALNCLNRKAGRSEPCNVCERCREINEGRCLDIFEIDAASHTGVDNVRENIIAASHVTPSYAKYKVFIIDEVHMLSASAFNALLKIIEEPPTYVIFILCTTEVHKVPSTIISRCQRFDFKRISVNDITKKLQMIASSEGISIDKKILESIARQSEGHMRDAESLLGQVVAIGGKEITPEEADLVIPRSNLGEAVRLIELIIKKDAGAAVALVNNLVDDGINLKVFTSDLIELLRKIMLNKINPALSEKLGLELGETLEMQINQVARGLELRQIVMMIETFLEAKNDLKDSFIVQLPVEIAIAQLCSLPIVRPIPSAGNISPNKILINTESDNNQSRQRADTITNKEPISKELILSRWNEVLAKIKKYNHSLSFILRVCQPVSINNNQLCLAFKYKFHKDRISDANIKRMLERVIEEVYGQSLIIEALVDENLEVLSNDNGAANNDSAVASKETDGKTVSVKDEKGERGKEKNMLDNLLKTFGGKIVK